MKFICSITLCLGLAVITSSPVKGQPSSWQRLNTPHFSILFPAPLEREAHRVANTLEHLYEPVSKSLNIRPRRITVILRNQTTISNGFASMTPWKVEYFTFPMHDYNFLHGNDWLDLLSVHELRHVVQFERFKKKAGILPPWFFEGDAVGIETALTKGGRGRIPYFSLLYKVNLLEREPFSILKQEMGSLRDPVPNYYRLGYYFTTHLRRKYGEEVIDKIFQNLGIFTSFSSALKKATGQTAQEIYEDTNQELKELWSQQLQGLKITPIQKLNKRDASPVYTNYSYPQVWGKHIIALKQGLATASQLVVLNEQGKERMLLRLGYIKEEAGFSVAQDKLVWIEQVPDLRWEDRSYSIIQLYDLKNKKLKTLTTKSRYATAALSPDDSKIVALESDEAYNHQLVILDSKQGKVLQRLPNTANHYYLNPRFSPDSQHIIAIKQADQQATIVLISLETGIIKELIPPSTENLGFPLMAGNYVFYNSAYSGIDNIYALDLTTQKRYQVTSSKYGAYYAAMQRDEQAIVYNEFTKDGMDVVKIPLDSSKWTPLEKVEIRRVNYYEPLVTQENNPDVLKNIPQNAYPVEKFHPWKQKPLLDIYVLSDPFYSKKLVAKLTAKNWLNTAEWTILGYKYQEITKAHDFFTRFSYKGWYPVLTIGTHIKLEPDSQGKNIKAKILDLGIKLPLVWMHGAYSQRLTLSTVGSMVWEPGEFNYIQKHKVRFRRAVPSSPRDIYSPWEQNLLAIYQHVPYGESQKQLYATKAAFYFPGLTNHHSLRLGISYYSRSKTTLEYIPVVCTRGYENHISKKVYNLYNTSLDYALPLAYPDWELLEVMTVKRLYTNLFFDWGYLPDTKRHLQVLGIDFLMSILIFEIGVRYARKLEKGKGAFFFLLGWDLSYK